MYRMKCANRECTFCVVTWLLKSAIYRIIAECVLYTEHRDVCYI